MIARVDWFVDWFDSYHYHLLYENRDSKEAEQFIRSLFQYLGPKESSKILDLACGKGRHAMQVHDLGFDVLGVDLSEKSINFAKQQASKRLNFEIADMRNLKLSNRFDIILNLFTSFGYFKKEGENVKVITSIANTLNKGGLLVLDYLNVLKVKEQLPSKETVQKGSISFNIDKEIDNDFIVKRIHFVKEGQQFEYKEYVKLIDLKMFTAYFHSVGLEMVDVFGDYQLNDFDESTSDRLILIAKKR